MSAWSNIMTEINEIDMFKRFYSLSDAMLCIVNSNGNFVNVNTSFRDNLGFDENELELSNILDYIHPEDLDKVNKNLGKIRAGKRLNNFITRFKCKNKRYQTLSWNTVLDDKTGLFYTSVQNITMQMDIKNELKQIKSAIYKETVYAESDINGNIINANKKFTDISGYTKDELIGQNHRFLNSGVHPYEFFTQLWQTISSGKVWSGLIQNKKKNGDSYYVQSILIPIIDSNEKVTKYISIRQDITDHINTDLNYKKAIEILSEATSIGKIGGWELNISTGELLCTDETFKILGVEQKQGMKPMLPEGVNLFIEKDIPIINKAINRAIEFGEPYNLELEACTPAGEVKWVYVTGKPKYKEGKIDSIFGIIQDIHDSKIAKIKLIKSQQQSIHNAKFAALGELSASIAHEINNPLGVISGNAELMQMLGNSIDNDKFIAQTNTILRSCDRISHIVKSLKKFAGNYDVEPKKIHSLKSIVNEVIVLTKPKIKQNMISLNAGNIDEGAILCNEIEIEQVLVNLINNAVEAISHLNDRWIELSVTDLDDTIQFSITDSGQGIPKEKQLQIFEPFYTSKREINGTGLGLSIVKEILAEHNANIEINNKVKGTCFDVTFPKFKKD